ncbi:MAG: hypothetical protein OEO84_06610 [Betaproteobacteria bacterium]|nr:hypothetical protein [Betaproteobacteria bacterium]
MPRALKTLAVLLLVALMPLRAMAAVTVGFCATGQIDSAAVAHVDSGHGAGAHEHHGGDVPPAKSGAPSCSSCVEHCSGASFAPHAAQAVHAPAITYDRIFLAERVAPAFISDPLDRPPLA